MIGLLLEKCTWIKEAFVLYKLCSEKKAKFSWYSRWKSRAWKVTVMSVWDQGRILLFFIKLFSFVSRLSFFNIFL